jgi:predicted RNA binding protein YcfA (HicA-like mRNA interferase family)
LLSWLCETPSPFSKTGTRRPQPLGFVEVHRKGSHVKMKHADGRVIVFPFHDEVDRYKLKGALRDADVDL